MKYIRATYFWIAFSLYTLLMFVVIVVVHAWTKLVRPDRATKAEHAVACTWGRGIFALMPSWSYDIEGAEHLPREGDQPFVIVANHQSAADISTIFVTGAQFRWLSKAEVFKLPLIGQGMRWCGYVPIRRGDKDSHTRALEKSAEWLRKGVSMVFFPEGTRSETGELKPFKSGAFRLAEAEGVAILPMAIIGTRSLMEKGAFLPKPGQVRLVIMPPIRRETGESLDQFMNRARGQIQNAVSAHQPRTAPSLATSMA